jgi:alpha-tubulin suppressor-like RCC1 family protein
VLGLLTCAIATIPAVSAVATDPGVPNAWGANPYGQLGDGTTLAHTTPAPIGTITDAVDIAGGREHAAALRPDGRVWTWGRNNFGQIGDGTTQTRTSPIMVPGITDVVDVSTGHYHTLAIRSDGTAWGWGYNALGQLGDGTMTNRRAPVRIGTLTGVTALAGGRSMSYAILADGTLWACGSNAEGQLGDGTRTTRLSPVRVGTLTNVIAVAGGRDHGLAVKSDGTVWAWGDNAYGQLGDGTTTDRLSPIQVGGIGSAIAVAAGAYHSAALLADGSVRTWGRNNLGQLGDGSTTQRRTPVGVPGLSGAISVGAGRDHTLAVMGDGSVRAWGRNDFGQLGDGSFTNRTSPISVPGLTGVQDVHGGQNYSVALVVDATPDVTPPSAPGKPSGQSTSVGSIDLIWAAATDDSSTSLDYRVFRDGAQVATVNGPGPTVSFTDTGLAAGSSHTYVVIAVDGASNEGPASEASDPITVVAGTPVIFADDFSSGTLGNWTAVTRFAIDGTSGNPSPPSARASVANQTATMNHAFGSSYPTLCVGARVNVSARTGSMVLWRLRTAANGAVARLLVNASGVLSIRSDVSGVVRASGVALGSGWHSLELCGTVGTAGAWDLYRDGARIVNGWSANTGTVPMGSLELGNPNAATWTASFDDVVVDQTPS